MRHNPFWSTLHPSMFLCQIVDKSLFADEFAVDKNVKNEGADPHCLCQCLRARRGGGL